MPPQQTQTTDYNFETRYQFVDNNNKPIWEFKLYNIEDIGDFVDTREDDDNEEHDKRLSDIELHLEIIIIVLVQQLGRLVGLVPQLEPGSNVNSFRELNWETAAFEQQVRQWVQWLGDKATSSRLPPFVQPIVNSAKNYAKENPLSAITLLTLLATCALPIAGFLTFAVATILVTFIGFIFVEGTVLTVATVLLGGVLIAVAFITLSALVGGLVAYFFASQVFNLLRRHSAIVNILRRIPVIGHLFANLDHSERNGSLHNKSDQLPGGYMENGGGRFGVGGKDLEYDEDEEVDSVPYEIDEDHDDTYDYRANNTSSPVKTPDDVPDEEILAHND